MAVFLLVHLNIYLLVLEHCRYTVLLWFTGQMILLQVSSDRCALRNICTWTQARPQEVFIERHLVVCITAIEKLVIPFSNVASKI